MPALPIQTISQAGNTPTFTAVSASDTFANDGKTMIVVKNASGAGLNVTPAPSVACNQGVVHAGVPISVPAGTEKWIGPFRTDIFGEVVTVAFSAQTSITAAPIRQPKG